MKQLGMYFNNQILQQTTQRQQQKIEHRKKTNKKISINELQHELVKNFEIYNVEFRQSILNFSLFARRAQWL